MRRYEARATASGTDAFRSARRRLTAICCGILAAIIGVLNLTPYGVHSTDVERREREGRRERQGRVILFADLVTLVVGGAASASLLAGRAHGHVLVLVEDTGIGIPEEDLPRVTEPFFRGDRTRGVAGMAHGS